MEEGRGGAGSAAADRDARLRRALDYIEANLGRAFPLEEAAEAASWSFYHFHRRFAAAFGLGPGSYLRLRRLSEAARDLACGGELVRDIAHARGFGSSEALGRSFRASFGLLPGEYRLLGRASRRLGPFVPVRRPLLGRPASSLASLALVRRADIRLAGLGRPTRLEGQLLAEETGLLRREAEPLLAALGPGSREPPFRVAFSLEGPEGGSAILSVLGFALAEGRRLPEGLSAFVLPGGEYLRALHRGPAELLPRSHLELYAQVLPRLRRLPAGGFDFDRPPPGASGARADPASAAYETEIFIPLAPPGARGGQELSIRPWPFPR
ncbi:MAG TPA: AraC family transcriptional regulator [Spirochaetales bacterium]|nr:AraC family transcriptional regulator [Spirochaetales bacterium]HRY55068.1 AraC family transcriptional regulator [Spirochaetia bacterium]HRZ64217.1 AraC family transcriptional regulator [Spirochaetia bacterium]